MVQSNSTLRFLMLGSLIVIATLAYTQPNTNPFELNHRLQQNRSARIEDSTSLNTNPFDINTSTASSIITPSDDNNPFDIQGSGISSPVQASPDPSSAPITTDKTLSVKPSNDLLFWPILGSVVFLTLLVTLYRNLLGKIYRAFTNENVLKLLQREQSGIVRVPFWLWYGLFCINAGIFAFLVFTYLGYLPIQLPYISLCIAGIAGFFLIKHFVLKIIEATLPFAKAIKQYSFTIVIFNIILGIALIPLNVLIAFAPQHTTWSIILLSFTIILFVYLFRHLRSLALATTYLSFHKFHFFMYLCTVEIAPLLIIVKLLMNGDSINF